MTPIICLRMWRGGRSRKYSAWRRRWTGADEEQILHHRSDQAFETLIQDIKARYILLSYNNMAEKGNGRSNAKISDDDIMRILGRKGR